MQRYGNTVLSSVGLPLAGATVTVKLAGTQTLATLYSGDGVNPLANPFQSEADGSFNFYAANGRYDITFTLSGYSFDDSDFTDILLFDFSDEFGAKGVLLVGTGNGTYVAVSPGSDRYALIFDSAQAAGVRAKNMYSNLFVRM